MLEIDYSRDSLLTDFGIQTLKDRYLLEHESSPQDAFARAALAFSDTPSMAKRMYNYASKLWLAFSTPVLSNAPVRESWGEYSASPFARENYSSVRGLPISCFLNDVHDSRTGITDHYTENAWLASMGGGIGGNWSGVRSDGAQTSAGSRSSGVIPFMGVVDRQMLAFSQGKTRRGSYAAFIDISHPEIVEFLGMRKPTGGDINRKNLNLHHGVCVPDAFMEIIENCMKDPEANDDWPLVDPDSHEVVAYASAKELWERLLDTRHQTGEPYIVFIDRVNEALPQEMRDAGLRTKHSNLCVEITLPTTPDRTAVCCLSSVNLETYDEWKNDEQFIADVVRFLDNVLEYFILNAPEALHRAVFSAKRERSIGIGALGFHSYLQKHGIPFESVTASAMNKQMFKRIKEKARVSTKELAKTRGAAPDVEVSGWRNAHLLAVAPNASSSIICGGASPSIEPIKANIYTHKTLSGSFKVKNKYLDRLLRRKYHELFIDCGWDYGDGETEWLAAQWKSIGANRGSVQHLDYLSDFEKSLFKTALELDQQWVISHAADRQVEICQSQSVNVFVPADIPIAEFHAIHFNAWKRGMKTLYYCRSEAARKAENVGTQVERAVTPVSDEPACLGCEG